MRLLRLFSLLLTSTLLASTYSAKGQDYVVCPDNIPGFQLLSEYNGHAYYLSDENEEWLTARKIAHDLGGYLTTINDAAENEHIHANISEIVFIGYNDANEDGEFTWANGDESQYVNFTETPERQFAMMNPWDGSWSFEQEFTRKRFIVEFSCGELIEPCDCGSTDMPVCGTDFVDYPNPCEAECAGLYEYFIGTCDENFGPDLEIAKVRGFAQTGKLGEEIAYFVDIVNSGNRNAWDKYQIKVYLSKDDIFGNGNDTQVGVLCTGNTHIGTLEDVYGEIGIGDFVLEGSNYLILVVDEDDVIKELDENNNVYVHDEQILIEKPFDPEINCPTELFGYNFLGQYGNNRYFISNFELQWEQAKAEANSFGVNLVSINTQLENIFLSNHINEIAFIGLHDIDGDGAYNWESADEYTYENFANPPSNPYVHFNGFNGLWGDDDAFTQRRFILEFPCESESFYVDNDPCDDVEDEPDPNNACAPVEINFFKEVSCLEHLDDGSFIIKGKHNNNFVENTYSINGILKTSKISDVFSIVDYSVNSENIIGADRFGNVTSSVRIDQRILNTYSGEQSNIALVEKRELGGYALIAFHNFPNVVVGPDGVESNQNFYLHILDEDGIETNRTFVGKVTYVDPPSSGDTYLFYRKILNLPNGGTRFYYSIVYENSINNTERSETFYIDIDENFAASEIQDDDFDCEFGPHGYKIESLNCGSIYKFNNVCWGGNGLVSSYEIRDYESLPYQLIVRQDFDRSFSNGIEWHNIQFYQEESTFHFANEVNYLDEDLFPGKHQVSLVDNASGARQEFGEAYLVGDPQSIFQTEDGAYKILSTKNGVVALATINCKDDNECNCEEIDEPVCGYNGETYANACEAECAEVGYYEGVCETLPDLSITYLCCLPERSKIGETETFSFDLSNDGDVDLDAHILINMYLSEDQILNNEDDIALGQKVLQYVPAGELKGISANLNFSSIEKGTYYLHLAIDPNNVIGENNEQNNFWISAQTIIIEEEEIIIPPTECTIELAISDETVCVTALEDQLQMVLLNDEGYFKNTYDGMGNLINSNAVDIDEVYPNQILLQGNRLIEMTHSGEVVNSIGIDPELSSAYGQGYNKYGDVCKNEDGTYWLSGVLSRPPGNPDQGFPQDGMGEDEIWIHLLNQNGQQLRRLKIREITYSATDFYYLSEDHYQVLSLIPLSNGGVELLDLQAYWDGPNYNYLSTEISPALEIVDTKPIYSGGIFAGYEVEVSECQNKLFHISIYGVGFPNNAYREVDYSVYPPKTILDYQDTQGVGAFENTTAHQSNYYFHDGSRLSFGDILYDLVAYYPRQVRASYHDENDKLINFVDFYLNEQPQAILKNADETFTIVYYNGEHTYLDNSSCYNDDSEQVDCLEDLPGFTFLGAFENSTYFISNEFVVWQNAHYVASSFPGTHLVTISSLAENEFLKSSIKDEAYIGLNDNDLDGIYEWIKNEEEELDLSGGTADGAYVYMDPMSGDWLFAESSAKKKYLVEMPCIPDSTIIPLAIESLEDDQTFDIDVYPNPSSGKFYLDLSNQASEVFDYKLYDLQGRMISNKNDLIIKSDKIIPIDLSGWPKGVYCLKLIDKEGRTASTLLSLF